MRDLRRHLTDRRHPRCADQFGLHFFEFDFNDVPFLALSPDQFLLGGVGCLLSLLALGDVSARDENASALDRDAFDIHKQRARSAGLAEDQAIEVRQFIIVLNQAPRIRKIRSKQARNVSKSLHFVVRISKDDLCIWGDIGEVARFVCDENGIGNVAERNAVQLLTFPQGLFRLLALGDVLRDHLNQGPIGINVIGKGGVDESLLAALGHNGLAGNAQPFFFFFFFCCFQNLGGFGLSFRKDSGEMRASQFPAAVSCQRKGRRIDFLDGFGLGIDKEYRCRGVGKKLLIPQLRCLGPLLRLLALDKRSDQLGRSLQTTFRDFQHLRRTWLVRFRLFAKLVGADAITIRDLLKFFGVFRRVAVSETDGADDFSARSNGKGQNPDSPQARHVNRFTGLDGSLRGLPAGLVTVPLAA